MKKQTLTWIQNRLKQLRQGHVLTQHAFSQQAGISRSYYQAIECGKAKDPSLTVLQKLAASCDLEVHQLLSPFSPPAILSPTRSRLNCCLSTFSLKTNRPRSFSNLTR